MGSDKYRTTIPGIFLIEEKYRNSVLASICFHGIIVLLVLFGGYLLPETVIQIGSGPAGGTGGEIYSVGVVDEFSGGAGMVKPSITRKPPALIEKVPTNKSKAVPLPATANKRKSPVVKKEAAVNKTSVVPTAPEPGSGGVGGQSGGIGGGVGIVGAGSGEFGNSWYVRMVEARISREWTRPPEGIHVEVIYSFYIGANGIIYNINLEKSSGNQLIDLSAKGAIQSINSNPLPPPPPEFRGRPIKFMAHFIHPPNR